MNLPKNCKMRKVDLTEFALEALLKKVKSPERPHHTFAFWNIFPFTWQVLLGQPPSAELYGFVADYLEHKLQERAGSSMTEERPEELTPYRRMESQNSFDRNIDEITRSTVQSATMDTTPSPKKRVLRREGTFSIYDSGKQSWPELVLLGKLMMENEANANATTKLVQC